MTAQIYDDVVLPVVGVLGGGKAAAQLVYRTGLAESGYKTTRQYGDGPALGYWQMEPVTHDDIWDNFLNFRPELSDRLYGLCGDNRNIELDPVYGCALCRVHYVRVPDPLPDVDDLEAQAAYWKQFYNTPLGAGTVHHFMEAVNVDNS